MEQRCPRRAGEKLELGGISYRLEGTAGSGGSAIVYRAVYEDGMNAGCFHRVLIKELFPVYPGGQIRRDESGSIRCGKEAAPFFEDAQLRFERGNRANLELLYQYPEQISGNINSFRACGTCYSVLAVHGGSTLEEVLEGEKPTLREAARTVINVLEALECFHENGLLHMDISPDNILMSGKRALLIDYNSIWEARGGIDGRFFFSEKAGYSAPEIRLGQREAVGRATDLYAVTAVFFRMLTGRALTDADMAGSSLRRCFPKDLEIFRGEAESAAQKAAQIVFKGLHVLARRRYQTAGEMRRELEELLLRIDKKGITHSAVWEGSLRHQKRLGREREPYLEQGLETETGEVQGRRQLHDFLAGGGRLLIQGAGGMGKTRILQELWRQSLRTYRAEEPAVVYLSLADYQEAGEEAFFIRKRILRQLEPGVETEDALRLLDALFEGGGRERAEVILLLDGLNEAGSRKKGLIREIEALGRMRGLGIAVTDRSGAVKKYGLREFACARLMPLTRQAVIEHLEQSGCPCPAEEEMLRFFGNPMMLSLYKKMAGMWEEGGPDPARRMPKSAAELVGLYLESLYVAGLRENAGNETEQLRLSYILHHLLPMIAQSLRRRGRTLLSLPQLFRILQESYRKPGKKSFALAFPEFLGKTRLLFAGIGDEREWFDYAVREQLIDRLNLLEMSGDENYALIHENFGDFLAQEAADNDRRVRRVQNREWGKRGGIALLAGMLLAGGGTALGRILPENPGVSGMSGERAGSDAGPGELTQAQQEAVQSAVRRLIVNLYVVNAQLQGQREFLEAANQESVLAKEEEALKALTEQKEKLADRLVGQYGMLDDGENVLERLEEEAVDFPAEALRSLCAGPYEMQSFMEETFEGLEALVADAGSGYHTRDRMKALTDPYLEYLELYGRIRYLETAQVYCCVGEEGREEIRKALEQMPAFRSLLLNDPLSEKTEQGISELLPTAQKALEQARTAMRAQGLPVSGKEEKRT